MPLPAGLRHAHITHGHTPNAHYAAIYLPIVCGKELVPLFDLQPAAQWNVPQLQKAHSQVDS